MYDFGYNIMYFIVSIHILCNYFVFLYFIMYDYCGFNIKNKCTVTVYYEIWLLCLTCHTYSERC